MDMNVNGVRNIMNNINKDKYKDITPIALKWIIYPKQTREEKENDPTE